MVRSWVLRLALGATTAVALVAIGLAAGAQGGAPWAEAARTPRAGGVSPTENRFVPIVPCRIVNTQTGPKLGVGAGDIRGFRMHGSTSSQGGAASCGIPTYATALEMSVTALRADGPGYLRIGPTDAAIPNATFLNYGSAQNLTNAGTVAVEAGAGLNFQVRAFVNPTHVIVDVLGYYVSSLHATVNGEGGLVVGSGVVAVERFDIGQYEVTFDRDVSGCGISANRTLFAEANGGEVKASAVFGKAIVEIFESDGDRVDTTFVVTVVC